ncbi:hypothetical protein H5S09_06890 [Limosilactobacillus sp. STM2_1]|uniref:AbrB family transcriptional regulator n=1 Tax=Limosilactobacillus rudii TaxID=2759755 RepID=A0A7W3YNP1_9LACO|nr:hypothetical protein [Limosilactobacillus rudii]MBB1078782.1 hypothetical protein [Limosilactobacillus rudii]MBB1097666.1 hypothetical protein [Limosilactobacillus rudii]MCD7134775.1 hypothetical protein [Limosilactobacillus rudii]
MDTVKVRIQGNATVVTIPKSFNVKPGTEYYFAKGKDGTLILTPTKKVPATIEELFKDYTLHVQLDERTQVDGTVYIE